MGRKLDLSGLTEEEAEHVLQVVQRDFSLRKKEEERLSEMKQKLDEEGNKCSILSKHQKFNEHCCIRCCSPFTFLINSKRQCQDCKYNICKNCCSYQKKEKAWICCVCQQARLLRTQSLEWFYNNVKSRFKRFGSAKVLKNLYRKHRLESGACSDLIEGSFFEGSTENEGSVCGSDATFYRQSEGHSMMDTLAVALRVAEEAVEEAISKADAYGDSLDKQNEACYLREHKEELIEELATTIVQKIIRKQQSQAVQAEAAFEWPQSRSSGLVSAAISDQSMLTFPGSRRGSFALWRSQSAFSLTMEDAPSKGLDLTSSMSELLWRHQKGQSRRKKEHKVSALPSWKSVDRLNEISPPPVLHSTDGNWVALQNVALPLPRMLAKPKSQVFKALENESSVVSAYDEMGSDSEDDYDWNVALNKLRQRPRQLSEDCYYTDSQYNTEWAYGNDQYQPITSPSSGLCTNTETVYSDSETSSVNSSREAGGSSQLPWLQRRSQSEKSQAERTYLHGELDVNFNPQTSSIEYSDSSEAEEVQYDLEKRSRRWRKSKVVSEERCEGKHHGKTHKNVSSNQDFEDLSESDISSEDQHDKIKADPMEEELKSRLFNLAAKMNDKETSSGEEQESEPQTESENLKESVSSEENSKSIQDELNKKYSAVSLCNISTEVLKVINATEELIAESTGPGDLPADTHDRGKEVFPLGTDPVRLDEQLTTLEENISDIESRISALTCAGLNVAPCVRLARKREQKQMNQMQTIDTSRQQRRKLPAPPVKGEKTDETPVTTTTTTTTTTNTTTRTFNRNFMLRGSLTQRTKERKSTAKDPMKPTIGAVVMY